MASVVRKILVIRLSSIGDIVLTTPVLRALRRAQPQAQLHYLTKRQFADVIAHSPHIDRLHLYAGSLRETLAELRAQQFDYVVDLHGNLRSFFLRTELAVPAAVFPKQNLRKMLMTALRMRLALPHVVERYARAAAPLGAELDEQGLEMHYPPALDHWAAQTLAAQLGDAQTAPFALCLSASYATKRWLPSYYAQYMAQGQQPCVLLGGAAEQALAAQVLREAGQLAVPVYNAVGQTSILESAALLRRCTHIITPDTGMMHIAAALQVPAVTLWGNTVPEFGMGTYHAPQRVVETTLSCRPCSKLGHASCPRGHFRCMTSLTPERVAQAAKELLAAQVQP